MEKNMDNEMETWINMGNIGGHRGVILRIMEKKIEATMVTESQP